MDGKNMRYDKDHKTITISQNTGITVSIALLIMFAGAVFTIATWTTDVRRTSLQNSTDITNLQADVVKLQAENIDARVKLTEIQTQLKNIDLSLIEIKEAVRSR